VRVHGDKAKAARVVLYSLVRLDLQACIFRDRPMLIQREAPLSGWSWARFSRLENVVLK